MNAQNQRARLSPLRRLKGWLHSAIALAFLFVPMIMLVLLGFNMARGTVTALSERGINEEIAAGKVKSQDGRLFHEPIVSVTFDDGWKSIATEGASILAEHNIATTQYVITDNIGDPKYMTFNQVLAMKNAGHEIGSHTVSHKALGEVNPKVAEQEMRDSKAALVEANLIDPERTSLAYPYGSYNESTVQLAAPIYHSVRNVHASVVDGFDYNDVNIEEHFDQMSMLGYTVHDNTDMKDLRQALEYTVQNNGWLILSLHQVDEDGQYYSVTTQKLRAIIGLIKYYKAKTMTVGDALASREK